MIATTITAGRASRLAVSSTLHAIYQDSGYEDALAAGNLDAAEQVPTGSHVCLRALASRNVAAPALVSREAGCYTITARTANGAQTYAAIGDRDALMDAAYDDGALGVTAMVMP